MSVEDVFGQPYDNMKVVNTVDIPSIDNKVYIQDGLDTPKQLGISYDQALITREEVPNVDEPKSGKGSPYLAIAIIGAIILFMGFGYGK